MTPAHGAWWLFGFIATGGGAAAAADHSVEVAVISLIGGLVIAVVGPIVTAWARSRYHRDEQTTLNNHLIDEMERISDDNDQLRAENEALRAENARLLHRRR